MKAKVNQVEFKKYVGVANFMVKNFNPKTNKKGEEQVYVRTTPDGDKVVDLRFYLECAAPKFSTIVSFGVKNKVFTNKDQSKVKVIDKYGETCWMTTEQFKAKELPVYSNGNSPYIDVTSMRPCLVGEEEFIKFMKCFLFIEDVKGWNNDTRKFENKPYTEDMECFFDWKKIFSGDFTPITEFTDCVMGMNQVRLMVGVRTTDKGQFMQVYTGLTEKPKMKITEKTFVMFQRELDQMIEYAQSQNKPMDIEYYAGPIKEYQFEATELDNPADEDTVFDTTVTESAPAAEVVNDPLAGDAPASDMPFDNLPY